MAFHLFYYFQFLTPTNMNSHYCLHPFRYIAPSLITFSVCDTMQRRRKGVWGKRRFLLQTKEERFRPLNWKDCLKISWFTFVTLCSLNYVIPNKLWIPNRGISMVRPDQTAHKPFGSVLKSSYEQRSVHCSSSAVFELQSCRSLSPLCGRRHRFNRIYKQAFEIFVDP
jgi:hypothetical protein